MSLHMKNQFKKLPVTKQSQAAFIVFPALIFVLLLILLALFMMRGVSMDEKMSSNTREKSRALEAAQTALSYAEWWLQQPSNATDGLGNSCSGTSSVPKILPATCTKPTVANVQTSSALPAYTTYTLAPSTAPSTGTTPYISTSGGVNVYYANPTYSIYYVGKDSSGRLLYSVYALAYGGNQQAVAAVQSLYYVQPSLLKLGNN
jgi:type IV pilus assembly protein PilX